MAAERLVFRDMIDDDRLMALPDLVTDRRFDLQLAARLETKFDFVANGTAYPLLFGDTRDRRETHTRRAANHTKDSRHGVDALNRIDIRLKYSFHQLENADRPDERD